MATEIRMPRLSWTMVEGVIQEWLKLEGATVNQGEPLLNVESDKSLSEVEASASGTLLKIVRAAGETAKVDEIIAYIGAQGEEIALPVHATPTPHTAFFPKPVASAMGAVPAKPGRLRASPAARRIALERGLDLSKVAGSGPDGTVLEGDVLSFAANTTAGSLAVQSPYGPITEIALTPTQRAMSQKMLQSKQEVVQGTTFAEVDMTAALEMRKRLGVGVTAMVARAVVRALVEHPVMNSSLAEDCLRVYGYVNLGVAVATERGLVVPVIHNAERLDVSRLAKAIDDLAGAVRQGPIAAAEMSDSTFTITNSGGLGALAFVPVVNYPENAILGMGKVMETPVVRDGSVVIRWMTHLAVSYNHRVIDGATAVTFLQRVKSLLEQCDWTAS